MPESKPVGAPGDDLRSPGLARRFAAIAYDSLLLAAVLLLAGLPLPLIPEPMRPGPVIGLLIQAYLLTVMFLFFAWFWVHGGQTLGMRAWRLKLTGRDDQPVAWRQAAYRFIAAGVSWVVLGAGFWCALFDPRRRTWHDRWSGTYIRLLPKSRVNASHPMPPA